MCRQGECAYGLALAQPLPLMDGIIIAYEDLYRSVFGNIRWLYYILAVVWIVILFYAMYSIADRHFTWSLENLSQYLCLSPDLAGLTLLPFGNGAPDFFTALFGSSNEPEMILGGSIGSGLVIITAIFGLVLLLARRPGQDRYHVVQMAERGSRVEAAVSPSAGGQATGADTAAAAAADADADAAVVVVAEHYLSSQVKRPRKNWLGCVDVAHGVDPIPFVRNVLMYMICVGFLGTFVLIKRIPWWIPCVMLVVYAVYMAICIAFHVKKVRSRPNVSGSAKAVSGEKHRLEREEALRVFQQKSLCGRMVFAARKTILPGRDDNDAQCYYMMAAKAGLVILKAPINLLLNCTILPVESVDRIEDAEEYVSLCFWHRLRCVVVPFCGGIFQMWLLLPRITWMMLVVGGGVAGVFSGGLAMTTSWSGPPRFFFVHVMYSFCVCISWIYLTSSELLACLASTGTFLNVPHTIVGIMVLAWGNSFGDLVADVMVAKRGAFDVAMTAIFSGPVQNALLTMGTGFLVASLRNPSLQLRGITGDMYVSLGFLVAAVVLLMVIIPFSFGFRIPRTFGVFLLVVYMLFLPCALISGLRSSSKWDR